MTIQVKNLCKKYEKSQILQDISFTVDNRSSLGIIGSSGCGKSTLLRQLAGIESPDSGEISINGRSPIEDKKAFQEEIAVVFQRHCLFPHLTIEKNITLILEKIKKQDKKQAQERAIELLTQFHMAEQKDKYPSQVSGGQAQRASIARALATNPSLLFLDEPTAALDPQLTHEVLQSVRLLKDTGISFIFITHEMEFLREFADTFLYLEQGHLVEQGDIVQLQHPQSTSLHQFLQVP